MSDDPKTRADARLEAALATAPIRDPRPFLRPILKHLRERDPAGFERALGHYESTLIPAVAAGADPLPEWLRYGRLLASLAGVGRLVAIDGTGRAGTVDAAAAEKAGSDAATARKGGSDAAAADLAAVEGLLIYLPDAAETPAVVLRCPRDATPAQDASIELLVLGRVTASAYEGPAR